MNTNPKLPVVVAVAAAAAAAAVIGISNKRGSKVKSKVKRIAVSCESPHCYGESQVKWDHTVLPATR